MYIGKQPQEDTASARQRNSPYSLVQRIMSSWLNSGRNITLDNFFTSIPLALYLHANNTTLVGTLKKNKPQIPPSMQPSKNRPIFSTIFGFHGPLTLASYVPKKNKAVVLLSTMHSSKEIREDPEKKPEIIMAYNQHKGGVDTMDRLISAASTKRKVNW